MTSTDTAALIAKRPAVHLLCYGAYLQSPIRISQDVLVVPLAPLGFDAELRFVAGYLRQFFGVMLTHDQIAEGRAQGADALPAISLIHFPKDSGPPEALEAGARANFERAEQIIAWVTGERLMEFCFVIVNDRDPPFFKMVPPHSRRRLRLGPGNTGDHLKANIDRLRAAADEDPRFAFAMSLFADATYEPNALFKVCRLFAVLESLAYALKSSTTKSRRAVKVMLEIEDIAISRVNVDGLDICYDRIEIAGRLRDKFFHGVPFRETDLSNEARSVFHLIDRKPEIIADALLIDCELALAKWANNASRAREAAKARAMD